ncbi:MULTISPECIES: MobF family relaxase [unclassified Ornithinimicrobium]|uniref:MobF family relaxase n=1 Tax=unclassified Ornithinimicrobium TaxID=2615080 RepID=UPI003853C642
MTLHKLSAGSGYEYLTRQVAAGDDTEIGRRGLEDYYAARGESPGRWTGSGLVGIDGLESGNRVTSEQMRNLFGAGRHPLTGVALGAPYRVYDSDGGGFNAEVARRLQARADGSTEPAKQLAQTAAARSEVAREYFVREQGREPRDARELASAVARYSRPQRTAVAGYDLTFSPVKSVSTLWAIAPPEISQAVAEAHDAAVQEALAFLERQVLYTREGKDGARQVETRGLIAAAFTHRDSRDGDPDLHTHVAVANKVQTVEGKWLSIYGRVLHQHVVAASEVYNTAVEAHLRTALGVRFVQRSGGTGDKRPVREIEGVNRALCELWSRRRGDITARQEELSREFLEAHGRPPTPVEQIALAQRANLETRAAKHEPRSLAAQRDTWWAEAAGVLGPEGIQQMVTAVLGQASSPTQDVSDGWVQEAAQRVVAEVEARRATWQVWHLQAEAQRQVRGLNLHPRQVADVVGRLLDAATAARSVNLTPDLDPIAEPGVLRRSDGTSVYRHTGSDHYTSRRVLEAEQRITSAAGRTDGAALLPEDARLAVLEASVQGRDLNRGQVDLVLALACSGRRVQLVLAPAGSGKTTAVRVLADAWRGHVGPVIGLAPSAAAASVLAEATGIPSETLAKLVHDLDHGRRSWLDEAIGRDTLVVVDEAGMADTLTLDRVITHALGRGACVRLVGDDQQLAAVGAGGVLRDIATAHGAVRLDEVVRFADPAEAEATLALRAGDASALGFYLDRDRVHVGDLATTVEAVFTAWSRDRASGRDYLMLAPTREVVASLNTRARAARLGGDAPGREVALADGTYASAGDVVITRRNDRRLGVGSTDWVKNGDRWTVTAVDGSALSVRHLSSGLRTRLPAGYAAEHVELGYASTVHVAQGLTTDSVHGIVTGQESRQLLYTMLTRGRHENHVHVVSAVDTDGHTLPLIETASPATATEVLQGVLARDGAAVSATTERARAADPAALLHDAAERYEDGLLAGAERLLGPDWGHDLDFAAEALVPGLPHAPAWPSLRAHLMLTQADGRDALQALTDASTYRGLDDADDPAAVLLSRLDRAPSGGPLGWLPAIPQRLAIDPVWAGYLTARGERVRALAAQVRQGTTPGQRWAAPLAHHMNRDLLADLTVWRAARGVDHTDSRPVGPLDAGGAAGRYARGLLCRVSSELPEALRHWERLIVEHVGHRDWFTPRMAERLDRLHRAGVDVPDRLEQATAQGPLPDDEATSALWFRMIDPQQHVASTSRRTEPKRMRPEDRSPAPSGPALHGPSR